MPPKELEAAFGLVLVLQSLPEVLSPVVGSSDVSLPSSALASAVSQDFLRTPEMTLHCTKSFVSVPVGLHKCKYLLSQAPPTLMKLVTEDHLAFSLSEAKVASPGYDYGLNQISFKKKPSILKRSKSIFESKMTLRPLGKSPLSKGSPVAGNVVDIRPGYKSLVNKQIVLVNYLNQLSPTLNSVVEEMVFDPDVQAEID
jgi:hypothetical protein